MESIDATGYQPRERKAFDHEAQTSMDLAKFSDNYHLRTLLMIVLETDGADPADS